MMNVLVKDIKRYITESQLKPRLSETILLQKLWNIVCLFNHHKSKINISNLAINGSKTNDNLEMCNGLNAYFSTVAKKLVDELQCINISVDSNEFKQYCDRPVKNSMFVQRVNASELLQLIAKLKKWQSSAI